MWAEWDGPGDEDRPNEDRPELAACTSCCREGDPAVLFAVAEQRLCPDCLALVDAEEDDLNAEADAAAEEIARDTRDGVPEW